MPYQLGQLDTPRGIDTEGLRLRIDRLLNSDARRYRRLWMYYRNPMLPRLSERDEQGADRPYRQAQEWGMPSRITGFRCGGDIGAGQLAQSIARKEVVIENDIGWRIDTMVDFLFGKPITIGSLAPDPQRREQIERLLGLILTHNGGTVLLQQLATLGAVHGFVDVLVKYDSSKLSEAEEPARDAGAASQGSDATSVEALSPPAGSAPSPDESADPGASTPSQPAPLSRIARTIRFEVVEPARALPLLSELDWRQVHAYVQVYRTSAVSRKPVELRSTAKSGLLSRIFSQLAAGRSTAGSAQDDSITVVEILTPHRWQRYEDEKLIEEGANSLGILPLVHIQNLSVPFQYPGTSDVETLAPLQDELNIRLSDRAHRITMQSFKMYLGKGIEAFNEMPVEPGRMWMTDNDAAEVIEFGGDPDSPSEDRHITELREAMDKASGVTPIAAGAIRNRVGNLTSAAALRVTLMALLAKTERKRTTYGEALARMCELGLAWLDRAGLFHTTPDERRVEIRWPNLLPDSQIERLREAQTSFALGVPQDVLLRELGYESSPSPLGRGQG